MTLPVLRDLSPNDLAATPLMGWSSAQDTLNQVQLRFDTLEEAITFAKKHGLEYTLIEPHARTPKVKSYADNFRYDRVRT